MATATASRPPSDESPNSTAEQESNIPVICNSSRSEEVKGTSKKPHGIHVNPKFLKSAREGQEYGKYVSNSSQYQHTRFKHDPHQQFNNGQQYENFVPGLSQHPRFSHVPRGQFHSNTSSYQVDQFPPRFPMHHSRFRQSFPPSQGSRHWAPFPPNNFSTFHGPGYRPPFPPNNFPPPSHFEWHSGAGVNSVPHSQTEGMSQPSFPGDLSSNQENFEYRPSHWQEERYFNYPHASTSDLAVEEPVSGPSYYEAFRDDNNQLNKNWENCREQRRQQEPGRSRSRSSGSGRRRRSSSKSSTSYDSESYPTRRSRSLSSSEASLHSSRRKRYSSSSESESDGTIWDSADEHNSDSDLDLSKQLDSLTSNVTSSKALLKDALNCLGSSKIQTMIPLELSMINKRELFQMCKELLDETDKDKLVKIMDGSVNAKDKEACSQSSFENSQEHRHVSSDSDQNVHVGRSKVSRKKKAKKKRKKKKKNHLPQNLTESEEESQESVNEGATFNARDLNTVGATEGNVSTKSSALTTQQSLLELIQIEYKTKAINVMLKNLGVATEISSLVSSALNTNGLSVQNAASNQEAMAIKAGEGIESGVDVEFKSSLQQSSNHTVGQRPETIAGAGTSEPEEAKSDNDHNENETLEVPSVGNPNSSNTKDTLDSKDVISKTHVPIIDEKELLEVVVEDVLDLGVGANEEIDFPDI